VSPLDELNCWTIASRLLVVVAAVSLLVAAAGAGSANAAYPPKPKPKPLPRVTCRISTIVDRRVAIACNAGRVRAGKRASVQIGKKIVARGIIPKTGRYLARFTLRNRLTRGTRIRVLMAGKLVATIRA
jgi:hypothetical protein